MFKNNILFIILIITIGCGQPKALQNSLNQLGSVTDPDTGDTLKVVPTKVESVISQRHFLPSFQKCLGLTDAQISARTKAAMNESISSLSLDGNVSTLSAPMMMSVVKIAGELCQDIVNLEINNNQRKYFPGFNLGGSTNSQSFNLSTTLQKFASSCWGRAATSDEIAVIVKNMTAVNLNVSKDKNAALFACTSALASSQTIRR